MVTNCMNEYLYDQLKIGQKESFSQLITEEMMDKFKDISGDINPMHLNDSFAKEHGFSGRIVYGMLTASLYSTLAGVYLPGKYCLLYRVDSQFRKPVFIGDTLTVIGTVKEKNDAFNMIIVKAQILNQKNEKVSKAVIEIGLMDK